jgi:hypothetical protein
MALTEIKTSGIDDDAVTAAKIANGAIDSTDQLTNGVVTAAKMEQVGASNDGKYLRANNGAPCSWETVSAGTTLSGSTNNTVVTVTGANAMAGEANLTFDGNDLTQTIDADAEGFNQTAAGNHYIKNVVDANRSSANSGILAYTGKWNGKEVAAIKFRTGGDTTNKDDGHITFETSSQNNISEVMRIDTAGRVGIGTDNPSSFKLKLEGDDSDEGLFVHTGNSSSQWLIRAEDNAANQRFVVKADGEVVIGDGDLKIGTSGHGIDFSATSDAAGMTNELLDDYETGDWTPTFEGHNTAGTFSFGSGYGTGKYTKIGKLVTFTIYTGNMTISGTDGVAKITGLPFTSAAGNRLHNMFGVTHATCFDHDCSGGYINPGATYGYFMRGFGTTNSNTWDGGGYLMMSGTYQTD